MQSKQRKKILVQGTVQGVGFRPFVYRLAVKENLKGYVANSSHGVDIEIEGRSESVDRFIHKLQSDPPVLAKITRVQESRIPVQNDPEFTIRLSDEKTGMSTLISPDIAVCDRCLEELFDSNDRRFEYPFINCTNCGPRYTIIKDIPYDRPYTTMAPFQMCGDCQKEYEDPADRRFHAQPNACHVCGPRVWLSLPSGKEVPCKDPILEAVRSLRKGKCVAIKGLGGFHLACDATNDEAVLRLRKRKNREEKPLAVMAFDLRSVSEFAYVDIQEEDLLKSSKRPIVLLKKRFPNPLSESVAPGNASVGTMLPYTPLHYLILKEKFVALVLTSGNISDEPIAIENDEALIRLKGIADYFLMHDRRIHLRSDDSVTRIVNGLPRPIRRSRGFVPVPVFLKDTYPSVLAVGAELKNTICFLKEDQAFLSQHIGDLENLETLQFFNECTEHLGRILQIKPEAIAFDLHPDYLSTQWALKDPALPIFGIQHHHAHIASCLVENGQDGKVIGLALDGTGYGEDGCIWGGEILVADLKSFERVGHFCYIPMPGGDRAIKEPWRMALSYLYHAYQSNREKSQSDDGFLNWIKDLPLSKSVDPKDVSGVLNMIRRKVNTPLTSSLGRLFDGVASLAGIRQTVAFEGQGAMELEMAMGDSQWSEDASSGYMFEHADQNGILLISTASVILQIREELLQGISVETISLKFHIGLVRLFLSVCRRIRDGTHIPVVALSGGCFQNRFLTERLANVLEKEGFIVLTHTQVPANDGGLSLGQAVIAGNRLKDKQHFVQENEFHVGFHGNF
jgi:hydrogenase maturation protein HypF